MGSRASRCGGCLLVLSYSSAVNLSEGDLHSTLPLLVVETAFGDCIEARRGGEVPREATPPRPGTLERTRAHTVHSAGLTERPTAGPGKQTNKWRGREGSQETGGESACASFPRCDAALFPTQNSPSAELAASHSELSECGPKRFKEETLREWARGRRDAADACSCSPTPLR